MKTAIELFRTASAQDMRDGAMGMVAFVTFFLAPAAIYWLAHGGNCL